MKAKERSLGYWIIRRLKTTPAQSMVEFAIALPVLLLATFGVVEFGRIMQAWLALENGSRFAVRYAVTGEYNTAYCDEAGTALGLTANDGNADCKVEPPTGATDDQKQLARDQTQSLQDWARLPSIRDAALAGSSGIAYDAAVSGNYLEYLRTSASYGNTFSSVNRGDPSKPGYFGISICSNRRVKPSSSTTVAEKNQHFFISEANTAPHYLDGHTGEDNYLFYPSVCQLYDPVEAYLDDAGGPGDRIRIVLTYRHNLIMPLISDWWPTLRLNTSRDGVVEKFRTSRVTGLSEGNLVPDTATFTASASSTNTATWTASPTWTATNTLVPCVTGGNGVRADYYTWSNNNNRFPGAPLNVRIEPNINFNWGSGKPTGTNVNNDKFAVRFTAQVMPEYTENYTFYTTSDDGQRLWINGFQLVNDWTTHGATTRTGAIELERCQKYTLVMEYFESTGSASTKLEWSSPSQSRQVIPQDNLFADLGTISTATNTYTPTASKTRTVTNTFTNTLSPTNSLSPTITYTNSRTPIPSMTFTNTRSLVPSMTFTRTHTATRTHTYTSTQTFTSTNTFTQTFTKTITPIPNTPTHTVPVTPTNSPTFKIIGG